MNAGRDEHGDGPNSVAFNPTDSMPLTRWVKLLMLIESAVSSLTVLLVAARAVNIFE